MSTPESRRWFPGFRGSGVLSGVEGHHRNPGMSLTGRCAGRGGAAEWA